MGSEQTSEFYDRIFFNSKGYNMAPQKSPWAPCWKKIAKLVGTVNRVVDLGCGPAHLAHFLDVKNYHGIDFSPVAIEMAKTRFPNLSFEIANINNMEIPLADTYIACEFLEHISNDLGVIRKLKGGTPIVASVPTRDSEGHARYFQNAEKIINRYGTLIHIDKIYQIKCWFVFRGIIYD